MATRKKSKSIHYSYSPATQELMITTVNPKDLNKVENIMLDSDHYLQWDPVNKEVVGFFALFVDADEKKEKFHSFPKSKDIKVLGLSNFFQRLSGSYV